MASVTAVTPVIATAQPAQPANGAVKPPKQPTYAELQAKLAQLQAENQALAAKQAAKQVIRWKISEKGAVSVYGMGRWPITLYYSQWKALQAVMGSLMEFVEEQHTAGKLATKE